MAKHSSELARVIHWNAARNNLHFEPSGELHMLRETLDELDAARDPVDQLDAAAELAFASLGTLAKLAHSLGISPHQVFAAVCEANDVKNRHKKTGKITQPAWFQGPEKKIEALLRLHA